LKVSQEGPRQLSGPFLSGDCHPISGRTAASGVQQGRDRIGRQLIDLKTVVPVFVTLVSVLTYAPTPLAQAQGDAPPAGLVINPLYCPVVTLPLTLIVIAKYKLKQFPLCERSAKCKVN